MNHLDIGKIFRVCAQHFDQTIVDFDGDHIGTSFGKGQCERAETRTDLEHEITTANICEASDFVHSIRVDDKVLPECSARCEPMLVEHGDNFSARKRHEKLVTKKQSLVSARQQDLPETQKLLYAKASLRLTVEKCEKHLCRSSCVRC